MQRSALRGRPHQHHFGWGERRAQRTSEPAARWRQQALRSETVRRQACAVAVAAVAGVGGSEARWVRRTVPLRRRAVALQKDSKQRTTAKGLARCWPKSVRHSFRSLGSRTRDRPEGERQEPARAIQAQGVRSRSSRPVGELIGHPVYDRYVLSSSSKSNTKSKSPDPVARHITSGLPSCLSSPLQHPGMHQAVVHPAWLH
jgi:hypothetical protein